MIIGLLSNGFTSISVGKSILLNENLKSPENLFFLENNIKITNSNDDKYQNGVNMFGLIQGSDNELFESNNSYLALTDMNGKFLVDPLVSPSSSSFTELTWVNESTILSNFEGKPMLWNIATNITEIFDFQTGHHDDMHYNPDTESFLILDYFVKSIKNTSSGEFIETLVDRVTEYTRDGTQRLRWDLSTRANLSLYDENINRLNISRDTLEFNGEVYPYPLRTNSMFWDTDNGGIYVNLAQVNQIMKINYYTREFDWIIGQGTNYTLYDINNTEVESLWYHASDVNPIGNNEFLLFDNNYRNLTDPFGNFSSSILRFKVDPVNETVHEIFRWVGPQDYTGYQWGSVRKLENDNYLAGFGVPVHSTGPNDPPYHTSYGGVAVEITPTGEIVWEMRLPFNWGFNRIHRISPTTSVSPIPPQTTDVGTSIDLNWEDAFSNFPKSYKITLDTDEVLVDTEWNYGTIEYKLKTATLSQGQHIITLTLTDILNNVTETATEVTILFPNTSKNDSTSFLNLILIINSFLIIMITYRKRRASSHPRN
ncbi:MAG: hypothetical protein HeimC2_14810 [Candidatus Heimdallarchaeota archaeon LC_2]|nr:MAG: hypothetical protein HeimC2_14810 [Candidatus Heimdallarchaeota archaeon LC_2]